jgi:molybdenum cofactor synthesis domain-containing protein
VTDPDAPDALVVTVSTRASAGVYADRSGPIIVEELTRLGFTVGEPLVVPDGDAVGDALRGAVAAQRALVITTGGTGLSPQDHTPEQTRAVVQREIPALAAEIARYGVEHGVPTALLSRGVAGVSGQTLIVNLPGSSGGARDGMAVLAPVLRHAVSQLRGGDHSR